MAAQRRQLDPALCDVWQLPAGTSLVYFVKDKEVLRECVEECKEEVAGLASKVAEARAALSKVHGEVKEEELASVRLAARVLYHL
jgi:hypothetical protein